MLNGAIPCKHHMHNMLKASKLKASQGPLHYNHTKQCSNDPNHSKQAGQNSGKNMLDSQHRWQERYAHVLAHKQGIMAQLLNTIKE